jgi:Zn ribbon nucleic-acid-binding protein
MNVPQSRPVCPRCKGQKVLKVKTAGGEEKRRCVMCGGTGEAGVRTK